MVVTMATTKLVDGEAIKKINVLTERVKKRIHEWQETTPKVSTRLSRSFTESWKETGGLPLDLRWAKAFQMIMKESPAVIREGELIVGSQTEYVRGVDLIAATDPLVYLKQLQEKQLQRRMSHTKYAEIDKNEEKFLEEDCQYWADHLPPDYQTEAVREELGDEYLDLLTDKAMVFEFYLPRRGVKTADNQADISLRLLNEGLNGVMARARAEQEKMDKLSYQLPTTTAAGYHKKILLKSVIMSCEAVIEFANRHAQLARRMAKKESNPARKRELEKIAGVCEWVPANPPRSFWEALQFVRFVHLAKAKETSTGGGPLGKVDQYLYPWYEKDLSEGKITRQEAAELLGCLWLKTREAETLESIKDRVAFGALLSQVTIGGRTKEGKDATNELSWLVLEVMRQMKLSEPAVYLRYHDGMSKEFLIYALECNRDFGGGNPAFLNDELGTARYLDRGVALEDAVDWIASGCLGYNIGGCDLHSGPQGQLNQMKIFEITLNNGFDPRMGKQLGLETGDVTKFTSIEQFYEAFFKQVDYFADKHRKDYFIRRSVQNAVFPNSGLACGLMTDCITKGLGPKEGGGRYPCMSMQWVGDRGTTDVADCLASIKYLVFDKKKTSIAELMEALKSNWEGYEDLHQLCLKAPKYGNDDDYVDDIFNNVSLKTQEILQSRPDPFTGLKPFLFKGAAAGHIFQGRVTGALPNGRKAGTPVNDGTTSAMSGMDVKGPTALINSATKVDHMWKLFGGAHNMKFDKALLNTPEKLESLLTLIKTYFARGGWHIQFNIHSAEDLLDARKHPEKWPNLVVRVAGFSAYFVDLPYAVQDEIITRTLHAV